MSGHLAPHPVTGGAGSIMTLEDWVRYCAHQTPDKPALLTRDTYDALDDTAREAYNDHRDAWHADFGLGSTSALSQALKHFLELVKLNRLSHDPVKAHLALSGAPHQGKTTIARLLGRRLEQSSRRRNGSGTLHGAYEDHVPVVYITLTSESSTRSLNEALLHYLGAPTSATRRYTASQLEAAVSEMMARHRVELLIIDDFHLLMPGRNNTEGVRNYLKALSSRVPIMLVLVGIDVEKSLLLDDTGVGPSQLAGQTGGRTHLLQVPRFTKGSKAWKELVAWTEQQLVLVDQPPGSLSGMHAYLWNRTQGSIGSLMRLIRIGALRAVSRGEEQLSKTLLDRVAIDFNAESGGNRGTE